MTPRIPHADAPSIPLIVIEDSEDDFRLLIAHLRRFGVPVAAQRVETAAALQAALEAGPCAAVISDHRLPRFTSLEALRVVRSRDPDLPFLIVSGAIGEELAVEAMRAGADDYVMKDNLGRLEPALIRALENARIRRRQREAEQAFAESEARFRALSANLPGMVFQLELAGNALTLVYASEGSRRLFGMPPQDLIGDSARWFALFAPADRIVLRQLFTLGTATDPASPRSTEDADALPRRWMEHTAVLAAPAEAAGRAIEFTARARPLHARHMLWDGIVTDITPQKRAEAALRASREELRELASYLVRVREEERAAIARELHDDIGSTLTGIKFQLAYVKSRVEGDAAVADKLAHLDQLVDGVIVSSSRLMHDLRPGIVDEGIVPALDWLARSFEQRTGVACTFEPSHEDIEVPPETSIALFRVCQEALNNVAKHACASLALVRLVSADGQLMLEIRDDGIGIGEPPPDKRGHFGLRSMRERAHALGGAITIAGSGDEGTTVTVTVPVKAAAASAAQEAAS